MNKYTSEAPYFISLSWSCGDLIMGEDKSIIGFAEEFAEMVEGSGIAQLSFSSYVDNCIKKIKEQVPVWNSNGGNVKECEVLWWFLGLGNIKENICRS